MIPEGSGFGLNFPLDPFVNLLLNSIFGYRLIPVFLLACSFVASAQPADSPEPTGAESAAETPADGQPAVDQSAATAMPAEPAPPTLEEQIADVETAVQQVDEELAELEAQPTDDGGVANPRIGFLRQKKLLLERWRSTLTRIRQLQEQLAPAEAVPVEAAPTAEEPAPAPSPTIQDFDVLLDQHEAAERQLEVATGAVDAQQAALKRAEVRFQESSRERRAAEESAPSGSDDVSSEAGWKATLAELRVHMAEALLRVTELERSLAEKSLSDLEEEVQETRAAVVFTQESLDERLAAIETQRTELNKQLTELYELLDKHQQHLERAQAKVAQAPEDEKALVGEQVTTAERELHATRQGEQYVQQRLENLSVEAVAWNRRFALFQRAPQEHLRDQLNEITTQLQEIRSDVDVVEPDLRNVLSSILEIQRRLDSPELNGGLRPVLETRLAAFERHAGYARDYLAGLSRQEKLLTRLSNALRTRIESEGMDAVYAELRKRTKAAWNYELFSYEDKAYRVAGLTYAVTTFVLVFLFLLFVRRKLRRWWVRVLTRFDGVSKSAARDLGLTLINNTSTLVLLLIAFWAGSFFLPPDWLNENRNGLLTLAIYLQLAIYGTNWLSRSLDRTKARMLKEDPSSVTAYGLLSFFGRFVIWVVFITLALLAMGFEITPLIAGLGVGGIAVAFALQNILADVFNSVAIVLDKPFAVGDFVVVGDTMGVVENIGIKTTRIRSLGGEQISVSNSDLLGSRIQNYKRMEERRVVFHLGVTYQTPADKLRAIPEIVREAIEAQESVRFDRAHFQTYGDFALIFECVYYVLTNDYNIYMDIQQAVNLIIYERFGQEGLEFAYPTQTLFVQREGGDNSGPA